ncbi:hypothetical protein KIPE111705_23630 [Kibdelosporangium persicum]|uniref:hypothetical protein n=1 Tax=Kibdelosporangium persicum TaxID=2698649 RepID=UPI0015660403|nr:hypothetical protein [Kibdelosporangium persicum]
MTTRVTSSDTEAQQTHGPAHYRTAGHGHQVLVPTRCPSGLHQLSATGYRIYETDRTLHVTCQSCVTDDRPNHTWTFTTDGRQAESAEFNNTPYAHLLTDTPLA